MPQAVAQVVPLTYLSDALPQVMVGGAPLAPLWLCAGVLPTWLLGGYAIASMTFRWQ